MYKLVLSREAERFYHRLDKPAADKLARCFAPTACYNATLMGKTEIIAALPHLSPQDLAEVQAKLDELAGETWHPQADLTDADKSALDAALAQYQKNPD